MLVASPVLAAAALPETSTNLGPVPDDVCECAHTLIERLRRRLLA
jgi:hypothetical protein